MPSSLLTERPEAMAEIFISGADGIESMLRKLAKLSHEATVQALGDCAMHCRDAAIRYAPRSPTRKQWSKTLKVKRRTARAMFPGGLEKSIDFKVIDSPEGGVTDAAVFVASNAPARAYARVIHDEKGKRWKNRGPGTIAKGPQADDKFVERAIEDERDWMSRKLDAVIKKELKRL